MLCPGITASRLRLIGKCFIFLSPFRKKLSIYTCVLKFSTVVWYTSLFLGLISALALCYFGSNILLIVFRVKVKLEISNIDNEI